MILTYSYRIKDATTKKKLNSMASFVNFVWNFCNETSLKAFKESRKFLSAFDLNYLMAGSSKYLPLHSQTFQSISREYVKARKQFKKIKLNWRSYKKSLGWIPFKSSGIKIQGSEVVYNKQRFKFWKSREIEGKIKEGSFNQDARGRWYVYFQCEVSEEKPKGNEEIGIDLGFKSQITCSNGKQYSRENLTKIYQDKLGKTQRAGKKKQVKNIHAKIKNKRKDWNHKTTSKITNSSKTIVIGDLKLSPKMKFAKSIYDSSFHEIKTMLRYKSVRRGIVYKEINENFSTVTCSTCLFKTGPSGLSALGVRKWVCSDCKSTHDRDVNAAKNIFRMGNHTLV